LTLTPPLSIIPFKTPAVRHLAWLCQTPQLVNCPISFRQTEWLPRDLVNTLSQWDRYPEQGPAVLMETPHYRLGLYFERLYECLMTDILGWTVMARNLPVRANGITLGELDFVVRNPLTHNNEHHEIAVKFYLGYLARNSTEVRWYGPNARDRLDIKSERMLQQQSRRCQLPESHEALAAAGIAIPVVSRIFMPGYLFYPIDIALPAPMSAELDHLRGRWLTLRDARQLANLNAWVVLRKPHWLGPWSQLDAPDAATVQSVFTEIEASGTPRLFASLSYNRDINLWQETERFFVVPSSWPGQ